MWFSIIITLMLAGLLAVLLIQWQRGRSGGAAAPREGNAAFTDRVPGTLTLTGVADKPVEGDKNHQAFCTVSGTITGPDTAPTDVYGRFVMPMSSAWPQIGDQVPVTYKPGKAESTWQIAGSIGGGPGASGPDLRKH
ncbi:hypothetical protein [Williamsia sp. D3]|uniref:hypothetical protein n=1 Tax=Williamsia sp. D3 TaxID=1313067 RepID=UPI0004186397|nr:hypothetical protein [Williamsia sp. D3]